MLRSVNLLMKTLYRHGTPEWPLDNLGLFSWGRSMWNAGVPLVHTVVGFQICSDYWLKTLIELTD